MKGLKSIMLLFVVLLLCGNSCEEKEDKYIVTIQNQSNEELIYQGSTYETSLADTIFCLKPDGKRSRQNMFRNSIKPHSYKRIGIDFLVNDLRENGVKWSLFLFDIMDVDTMTCEEFARKYPLKKMWTLTWDELEACDWTLMYTSEDSCYNSIICQPCSN